MAMNPSAQALIDAALAARKHAYADFSKFAVGAALLTRTGDIFVGCNVENRSYGLTMCAERTAIFTAVAGGVREFERLAIASPGGVMPCGACLQVLVEFCDDLSIDLVDSDRPSEVKSTSLRAILPLRFEWDGPTD